MKTLDEEFKVVQRNHDMPAAEILAHQDDRRVAIASFAVGLLHELHGADLPAALHFKMNPRRAPKVGLLLPTVLGGASHGQSEMLAQSSGRLQFPNLPLPPAIDHVGLPVHLGRAALGRQCIAGLRRVDHLDRIAGLDRLHEAVGELLELRLGAAHRD